MKSALIVSLFTVLRLGIPLVTMLILGEVVHHRAERSHPSRGG